MSYYFNKIPLFRKLFAVMLVLSIVPVFIAGIFVYSTSSTNLISIINETAEQHATEYANSIKTSLYDTENQMLSLGLSPSFTTTLNESESWSNQDLFATYEGEKFSTSKLEGEETTNQTYTFVFLRWYF